MATVPPSGDTVPIVFSGPRRVMPGGDAIPITFVATDTFIGVGPGGTTIKVQARDTPSKRILAQELTGVRFETKTVTGRPASLSDAASRPVLLNSAGQISDWMIGYGIARVARRHMIADGVLDTFTIEHNLGLAIVSVAVLETVSGDYLVPSSISRGVALPSDSVILGFSAPPPAGVYLVSCIG